MSGAPSVGLERSQGVDCQAFGLALLTAAVHDMASDFVDTYFNTKPQALILHILRQIRLKLGYILIKANLNFIVKN